MVWEVWEVKIVMSKRWEGLKFQIALFLNRNPEWCWSELVSWCVFHRWYSIVVADERIYGLWITEVVLLMLRKDVVDLELSGDMGVGGYMATGSEYCMKCVYVRERRDCYQQERGRVQRRGDRIVG